jgi:hypothetical protein
MIIRDRMNRFAVSTDLDRIRLRPLATNPLLLLLLLLHDEAFLVLPA